MREEVTRLKPSHSLRLWGKLLKRAGTCNLIESEEHKLLHIATLCKFKYEGQSLLSVKCFKSQLKQI